MLGDVYANDPATNADSRPAKIADTPAVGDINGDGNLDIVVGTEEIQGSIRQHLGADLRLRRVHPRNHAHGHAAARAGRCRCRRWRHPACPAVATGVISSPALFPSTAGNGTLQTATGVFLAGSDAAHPAFTINSNGTQGTILQTNTPGAGSNFTDSPFLWAVAQTAVGQLGSTPKAVVTGGLSTQIATDTAGPPGKKPGFQHAVGAYNPATGRRGSDLPAPDRGLAVPLRARRSPTSRATAPTR